MKRALIIGASGGIGRALTQAADRRGYAVTALSRGADGLDITDARSVHVALDRLDGPFDLVWVATGKLDGAGHAPEKSLKALTSEAMEDQFRTNCIGPALVLAQLPRLLPRRQVSHVGVLSARVGSIGDNQLGGWYAYRAAKAALNQTLHGAAIEVARSHPLATLAVLHPGTVATAFTQNFNGRTKLDPDASANALFEVLLGLGPAQSGGFYDWKGAVVPW